MKISLFAKNHDEVFQIEEAIKIEAFKRGITFDDNDPDVVIYIGGDGTFLNCIQNNLDRLDSVIFVGVKNNSKSLGFYYEFDEDQIEELFSYLDSGALKIARLNLMSCLATSKTERFEFYALNEIRFIGNGSSLKCDLLINDECFEHYTGNELVVSSSSGSTGLNKSVGGAIVSPDLSVFQITPIAPINNAVYSCISNPIILYNNVDITLKADKPGLVSFDYINIEEPVNYVNITRSNLYVQVFFRPNRTFLDKVKESFIK